MKNRIEKLKKEHGEKMDELYRQLEEANAKIDGMNKQLEECS